MAESINELQSLLMRMTEESEKADLKLNIQKTKIMVSSSIMSWQIEGKKSGSRDRFSSLELQKSLQMVTAAMKLKDACSLEKNLWQISAVY